MIQKERICDLNQKPVKDRRFVLYWMQAAQRAHCNHALEHAIRLANERDKPVLAAFCLVDNFPEANLRHYTFMLQGLKETQIALAKKGIQLVILHGKPAATTGKLAKNADAIVTDDGYLRIQRQWRNSVAKAADCRVWEVITNVIVPVEEASDKENFSAGTLRPRIHRQLKKYLVPFKETKPKHSSLTLTIEGLDISDTNSVLKKLSINRSVSASSFYIGGTSQAIAHLRHFIEHKLDDYADKRNDPMLDCQSHLSPYLHFGQVSPLHVALELLKTDAKKKNRDAFLEELIVRRELSHNFVHYNAKYDVYDAALPPWALRTLNLHARDKREQLYTPEQLENAQTYDAVWNASQMEMVITGKMHNYMRMYWGKKILEWTRHPREAFKIALYLNNKYELDGRDPNGFAGVAWCFGKHDRAWQERPVFGKTRYMNAAGLKRKFDTAAYIQKIEYLGNSEKCNE